MNAVISRITRDGTAAPPRNLNTDDKYLASWEGDHCLGLICCGRLEYGALTSRLHHTGRSFKTSGGSVLPGTGKLGGRVSPRFFLRLIGGVGITTDSSPGFNTDDSSTLVLSSFLDGT